MSVTLLVVVVVAVSDHLGLRVVLCVIYTGYVDGREEGEDNREEERERVCGRDDSMKGIAALYRRS